MSELTERIKKHFRDQLGGDMNVVEVPEWGEGDKPLRIYYKPMNLEQQNDIWKFIREGSLESYVQALIIRSLDEEGNRMFRKADRLDLMKHADPRVIERIVTEMGTSMIGAEDAEKNS